MWEEVDFIVAYSLTNHIQMIGLSKHCVVCCNVTPPKRRPSVNVMNSNMPVCNILYYALLVFTEIKLIKQQNALTTHEGASWLLANRRAVVDTDSPLADIIIITNLTLDETCVLTSPGKQTSLWEARGGGAAQSLQSLPGCRAPTPQQTRCVRAWMCERRSARLMQGRS